MNTKRTTLLLFSLWALTSARPVSRHQGTHHRSSEEHWAIAIKESLNEVADTTDVSDEDQGSRLSISTETRRKDHGASEHDSTSQESRERNSFSRKVSSSSFESTSEDDHEWSIQDNDDGRYFRPHQAVRRKWADDEDSHDHSDLKEMNGDSSDDWSAERMSLEDQKEIREDHSYSDIRKSKEHFDVENDGMLYIPDQVSFTFMGKGGSDLANDEDASGDDNLDGHNGEDPGYPVTPSDRYDQQPSIVTGEQESDNAMGRHHSGSSSSSSSSSSESRNLDKEDNHITDYGKKHGSDSYSSSQEDRYDFSDEGMQGDDPRILESPDSDSRMLHGVVHSKESSQQISREKGKGKANHHNKAMEHFARQVYHYVDNDSEEDHSPEHDESKSLQEDDFDSKENSQSVEDISHSTENVPSKSREDATSHSREAVQSLSRGHSHSQSREDKQSQSREDKQSQSREDNHSQSREDKHSQFREDKHSQSREDKHSHSREDKHSQSREDKHSWSSEDDLHSQSKEDDVHSRFREDDLLSGSREDNVHSQSTEDDVHSQSRENMASQSREDDDTVSVEDTKSVSTEDSRGSHEKVVKKSKELGEKSDELSASKSKEQESYSAEELGNVSPRSSESREVKRQHSRSSEKSTSAEESEESAEDTSESIQDDSRSSQSTSSDSSKSSQESASSEDSDSSEEPSSDPKSEESAETSESKDEENSHSLERDNHSRDDSMSTEDDSWSRSMEIESRKLMLDIDHNKPFSDYDDNDCQDGY